MGGARKPLVNVRCGGCRRVLGVVYAVPADTSEPFTFMRCQKCDLPTPARMVDVLMSKGMDAMGVTGIIPWDELRPSAETAWRRGRAQDLSIPRHLQG